MRNLKEVLDRVNAQEIRSFVLDGIDRQSWCKKPEADSLEERLREAEGLFGSSYRISIQKGKRRMKFVNYFAMQF